MALRISPRFVSGRPSIETSLSLMAPPST